MSERPAITYIDEAPDARPAIAYIGDAPPRADEPVEPPAEKRSKKPKGETAPIEPLDPHS